MSEGLYGSTRKGTLLESVPLGVTTWTVPVVAPEGTVVLIRDSEATVNVAAVPLKLTLVAPVKSVPRILTVEPTLPAAGSVFTNGRRPDLWLAFSEEHRHEVLLDATGQFRDLLRQVLDEERPDQNNMWSKMDLYHEAIARIFRMCEVR